MRPWKHGLMGSTAKSFVLTRTIAEGKIVCSAASFSQRSPVEEIPHLSFELPLLMRP